MHITPDTLERPKRVVKDPGSYMPTFRSAVYLHSMTTALRYLFTRNRNLKIVFDQLYLWHAGEVPQRLLASPGLDAQRSTHVIYAIHI